MAPCRDTGTDTAPANESWAPYFSNFEHVQPVAPADPDDRVFIGHMDTGYTNHPDILMEQLRRDLGRNLIEPKLKIAKTPTEKLPDHPISEIDEAKNFQNHGTATMSVVIGKRNIPGVALDPIQWTVSLR